MYAHVCWYWCGTRKKECKVCVPQHITSRVSGCVLIGTSPTHPNDNWEVIRRQSRWNVNKNTSVSWKPNKNWFPGTSPILSWVVVVGSGIRFYRYSRRVWCFMNAPSDINARQTIIMAGINRKALLLFLLTWMKTDWLHDMARLNLVAV